MYTDRNFKTKKALKEAVKAGEQVTFYQPGGMGGAPITTGRIHIEGPHYPEAHKWYAQCQAANGLIVKVI